MKTTKKQFETFKKECEKWIDFFGLSEWEVVILHKNKRRKEAWCYAVYEQQYCEIGLATETDELTCSIKFLAFHEVCHLLLAKLAFAGRARYTTQTELDLYEHEIVRRLENSVFKKLK